MIVNGVKVDGTPKVVEVKVADKMLKLTLSHIAEAETVEAEFKWVTAPEGIEIISKKVGNRVSTTIKKDKKVIFENLTAQSAFAVLEAAFGWTTSKSDGIYKKSNPARKESKKATASVVVVESKEGVGL